VYAGADPTDQEHNSSFNVVYRICEPVKNKGYTVYMDRWFSSPTLFDHVWSMKTKVVGAVMATEKVCRTDICKEAEKYEKKTMQIDHLLAIKWRDVCDVNILSTAHDDSMVDALASRGAHEKTKPLSTLSYNKYKIGVDKSDQLLSYYLFQRKSVKWWEKLFFHLFDLAVVNVHILHRIRTKQKFRLCKFLEKVADGLVSDVRAEITKQSWESSAGRLVGRDHFAFRIPATGSKQSGKTQYRCKVCADRDKHHIGKAIKKFTTVYCHKCNVGLCLGECFEIYHTAVNYWD
jgi:hypothetical protein